MVYPIPVCLSLLYNGHKSGIKIKCPNKKNFLELEIYKKSFLPKTLVTVKNLLWSLITLVYRPIDIPHENIYLKIVKTNKLCPKNYSINKVFVFNIWSKKEMCPAGFAQIFPILFKLKRGGRYPLPCPDEKGITYEIEKR